MSTQRYISTSFWDDEWIQSLDPSEKLLYLYYMTNTLTNIAGVYKITERRVSFDTGFNISTIQHIMQKFDKSGKVFRHGEWVVLPTWAKHQKVSERDNNRKGIDAILKSLPDDVFSFIVEKGYKYIYLNEIGRPLQGASKTLNYSDIELESNLDIECESKEPPIESAHTRFKKPTLQEVLDYCKERRNTVNAQRFIDYYESKGWKVGRDGMKDWKASVRTWEASEKAKPSPPSYSVTLPDWQKKLSGATDDRN